MFPLQVPFSLSLGETRLLLPRPAPLPMFACSRRPFPLVLPLVFLTCGPLPSTLPPCPDGFFSLSDRPAFLQVSFDSACFLRRSGLRRGIKRRRRLGRPKALTRPRRQETEMLHVLSFFLSSKSRINFSPKHPLTIYSFSKEGCVGCVFLCSIFSCGA